MDEELRKILKYLRLGGCWPTGTSCWPRPGKGVSLTSGCCSTCWRRNTASRCENARLLRRKRAHIPEMLEIETFPFARQPKLDRKKIMSLYDRFDYMTKQQNIVWLGPTGCGKSGLATGFLLQALDRGYRGYFITFPELLAELYASLADRSEEKVLRKYARYDCLVIDEVGYVEDRTGPGRPVLHADAEAAQDQDHADHLESGLQRVGNVPEEQPLDRRLARSPHGNQPRHQHEELPELADQAGRRRRKRRGMNFDDLRQRAAAVRAVPLETVLLFRGAVRDRRDRRKWHTEQGPLSVSGPKFMNWHRGQGGGGAIDLVMHLAGVDFRAAVAWLEQHLAAGPADQRRVRRGTLWHASHGS